MYAAGPPVLRVWATSTHPTLLLEPLSIWATFAKLAPRPTLVISHQPQLCRLPLETTAVQEAKLCVRGCAAGLPGVTYVKGGLVNEILHRHLGTLEELSSGSNRPL